MRDALALPLVAAGLDGLLPAGLIWACQRLPNGAIRTLSKGDFGEALASRQGWVWLHVDLVDQRAHSWIGDNCGLPDGVHALLASHHEGLALRHEAGVVHGACADFHAELDHGFSGIGRLVFAVSEHLLVTGRRHTLSTPEATRKALMAGARPDTAFDLFGMLIGAFCQQVGEHLGGGNRQLDEVEDRIVAGRISNERRTLMAVRRLALSIHRPVAALAAQLHNEDRRAWDLPDAGHTTLHRLEHRLSELDRDVVTTNERARLLQEELAADLDEESNRSLRALAVMSALLLPGTLIVGIFGMNTAGLPLAETPGGFWIALGLTALATALFSLVLKRAGVKLRF